MGTDNYTPTYYVQDASASVLPKRIGIVPIDSIDIGGEYITIQKLYDLMNEKSEPTENAS